MPFSPLNFFLKEEELVEEEEVDGLERFTPPTGLSDLGFEAEVAPDFDFVDIGRRGRGVNWLSVWVSK